MNIQIRWSSIACLGTLAVAALSGAQTWSRITATGGPNGGEMPLLMTDGTVMVHDYFSPHWYRLTPNNKGNYAQGTWKQAADMPTGYAPLFFASAVLKDGRMLVQGGEYNNGVNDWTNLGAIYDPVKDQWTSLPAPSGWGNIGDAQCTILPDGTLLMANPFDTRMAAFDPVSLTWSAVSSSGKADRNDEEGWTLLPDGTILAPDAIAAPGTERYIPTLGKWISAGSTPQTLADAGSQELGPLVLLPSGKVVAIGAIGHNALYTPGTNLLDTGSWAALPDLPSVGGQLGLADATAVLLPNGHVLFGASPGVFASPTNFFEFDGTGAFNAVPNPLGGNGFACFQGNFLMLPSGQALFTNNSSDIALYNETGTFQNAWRPNITGVPTTLILGKNFNLKGTQLNGMSQDSAYGDDSTNATNYPLVRVTYASSGHVAFFRTFNHSSMGVQTGSTVVSTNFAVPITAELGAASLVVVTNGIPSLPVNVTISKDALKPMAVGMYEGSGSTGTLSNAQTSDDSYFKVASINVPGTGQVASAFATFTIPGGSAQNLIYEFESSTTQPTQVLVFAWNYSTNKYVNVGSSSQTTTDKVTDVTIANAAQYIGPGGVTKIMIRSVNPTRANRVPPVTTLNLDMVSLAPG